MALLLALVYLVVCVLYIQSSGYIASRLADSVEELQRLESIKGTGFVVVTSGMLAVYSLVLFKLIVKRENELRRNRDALIALERRASTGLFASSVAHDINNVLVICEGAIADLNHEIKDQTGELGNTVTELREALDELRSLAARLENLGESGKQQQHVDHTDLTRLVKKTVRLAKTHKDVRFCTVQLDLPDSLVLKADASMMHQMLLNLVLNAAQATSCRGTVLIRLQERPQGALIEVHDNGPGIPREKREQVFSPFYSTRKGGAGLGLLAVRAYVQSHDGSIEVDNSYLGGACFRTFLPKHAGQTPGPVPPDERVT